jgi:hypothetical protein
MAKKNDNQKYALLALLLGVGGYFVYKKWKDSKGGDDKKEKDVTEEDVVLAVEQAKQAQSGQSFSPYQIQVMQLQAWLQISIDGVAGKQTLGKLDYYWAKFGKVLDFDKAKAENYPELRANGYGLLSPSNIGQYIANLNAGTSPRQTYWKSQASSTPTTSSTSDSARITAANTIIARWKSGTSKQLKFPNGGKYVKYVKDSSGKYVRESSWFFGGDTITFSKGQVYKFDTLTLNYNGYIIAKAVTLAGNIFYIWVSPNDVTNV